MYMAICIAICICSIYTLYALYALCPLYILYTPYTLRTPCTLYTLYSTLYTFFVFRGPFGGLQGTRRLVGFISTNSGPVLAGWLGYDQKPVRGGTFSSVYGMYIKYSVDNQGHAGSCVPGLDRLDRLNWAVYKAM